MPITPPSCYFAWDLLHLGWLARGIALLFLWSRYSMIKSILKNKYGDYACEDPESDPFLKFQLARMERSLARMEHAAFTLRQHAWIYRETTCPHRERRSELSIERDAKEHSFYDQLMLCSVASEQETHERAFNTATDLARTFKEYEQLIRYVACKEQGELLLQRMLIASKNTRHEIRLRAHLKRFEGREWSEPLPSA